MKHRPALAAMTALTLPLFAQDKPKPSPKEMPPAPRYAMPLVVAAGAKSKLTLRGARLDGATEVTTTEAKATVKIVGKGKKSAPPNNYPAEKLGDSEVELELDLPKDFAGASVPLVVIAPSGSSIPYALTVAGKDRVTEKEPNDGFAQAQELTLPVTLDGTIAKEKDVDTFRFRGKKGQKVRLQVLAAQLGSPADLTLTVYDADRQIVTIVDDVDGKPDPSATVTLAADGVYYVSLAEANDLGGGQFGYRLLVE